MNPKISLSIILIITLAASGYSQTKKTPAKPKHPPVIKPASPSAPIKGDNSLLFEITGRGLTEPSWLFGTMHILCQNDAKLSDGLKKVIKDCKQIFFEVDLDNMEEMMSSLQYVRMSNDMKLSDLLSPVEYDRVKTYFDSNKSVIPFNMMNRFKPFFIAAMISEGILNCEKKSSMEQMIMTESKKYEKNILGLETLEFQASLFDSVPYKKQAKDLLLYVDSIDNYRNIMLETVEKYRKQDINGIDSLMQKSDPGMSQYMNALLYDRNRRWAGQIPEQMFLMSTLFAVGAGHLGGEDGVISLLRKQGFTVKAIKN